MDFVLLPLNLPSCSIRFLQAMRLHDLQVCYAAPIWHSPGVAHELFETYQDRGDMLGDMPHRFAPGSTGPVAD